MSEKLYKVTNGPMVTTAGPAKVTTGTAIKTMLQVKPGANDPLRVVEWGISFDAAALATPILIELVETGTVAATVTAYVANDVQPYNDPNAPASNLQVGTAASGYTSSAEGSIVASRSLDEQLWDPAMPYKNQFPQYREPEFKAGSIGRIRVTSGVAYGCLCYIIYAEG